MNNILVVDGENMIVVEKNDGPNYLINQEQKQNVLICKKPESNILHSPPIEVRHILVSKDIGPQGEKGDPGQLVSDIYNMINPSFTVTQRQYTYNESGEISEIRILSEDGEISLFTRAFQYNADGSFSQIVTIDHAESTMLTKIFSYIDGEITNIDTIIEGL